MAEHGKVELNMDDAIAGERGEFTKVGITTREIWELIEI